MVISNRLRYEQSSLKIDYGSKNLSRMNLNENVVLPDNLMRSVIARSIDRVDPRFYPSGLNEGEIQALTVEISKYCNCSTNCVAIGSGGDQLLDLLFRMKLKRSSDKMVTVDPTYSMYSLIARRLGAQVSQVKLSASGDQKPFSLKLEEILKISRKKKAKMLVLSSPNNPTGIQYPIDEITTLLAELPNITLVLDEAYVEYGGYSAEKLLSRYKNLVILRTFSKAFGLASLRLGYVLSSDVKLIDKLNNNVQLPYPVSGVTIAVAQEMMRRKALILDYAKKTKLFRAELMESLGKFDKLSVIPNPSGNFVLVKSKQSRKIAEELLSNYAIAVKYIEELGSEREFLRITVGTRELNQKLLYALRRITSRIG